MSWSVSPVVTFAATFRALRNNDRWHRPPDLVTHFVDLSPTVDAAVLYT